MMAQDGAPFPKDGGMPTFWQSEAGELNTHRTTNALPARSDIVIVGAGYSAASIVTHLTRDPLCTVGSESILVLEARELCSGATGRNGGHLKPDFYNGVARLRERYGTRAATEASEFEAANVKAVSDYIACENVDCDFIMTRAMDCFMSDSLSERVAEGHRTLLRNGVDITKEAFPIPVRYAEKLSGVKGAKSVYSFTSGHLWPYKLVNHMFAKAIMRGVNLQTNTTVLKISQCADTDPDINGNHTWTVYTSRGKVECKKIIFTTNAYTAALLPEYKDRIIPYRAVCCRIACPNHRPAKPPPQLANSYSLRFSDWDFDYLIPRTDGSIIVGGARSAYLANLGLWYENADDSELISGTRQYFDGYMQRHFHGWEDSKAEVSHIWSGILGYSSDRLPRVGPIPNRPGLYIMAGFSGHGMPQIFLTGKGMAQIVAEDLPFSESGIPALYQETEARLKEEDNQVLGLWKNAVGASARL